MRLESRLEILRWQVAEAEADVMRQKRLIDELKKSSHSTEGAHILLGLLENTLREYRNALALIESS